MSSTKNNERGGQLQRLDEDMLLHIARFLSGREAYCLSLTAKHPFFANYFNQKDVRGAVLASKLVQLSMKIGCNIGKNIIQVCLRISSWKTNAVIITSIMIQIIKIYNAEPKKNAGLVNILSPERFSSCSCSSRLTIPDIFPAGVFLSLGTKDIHTDNQNKRLPVGIKQLIGRSSL